MSSDQTLTSRLEHFIKETLAEEEASDEDIVAFVRLVAEKKIKS